MMNAFYDRVERDEMLSPIFPAHCTPATAAQPAQNSHTILDYDAVRDQ
jgi:truncated hemoglobin YjbI